MELRHRLELSIGGGSAIEMTTGQPKFLMSALGSVAVLSPKSSSMSALEGKAEDLARSFRWPDSECQLSPGADVQITKKSRR
jgi:hypothetical protein